MRALRIPLDLSEKRYNIIVGGRIDSRFGKAVRQIAGDGDVKVCVVTHPRIERLYGGAIVTSLKQAGFSPSLFRIPEGEQHKQLLQVERIYDHLILHRFERSSLLVALGGGVIGDMTGFAAATFLRGVSYVQCPTTVVAQVDAAIGGKTGVDHPKGKNLIGAFHQPSLVFIDPTTLKTLPKREFVAGLAEIVKYGVIFDPKLFHFMERNPEAILNRDEKSLFYCIKRSVAIKAAIVVKDERESGLRKILNYGHTLGHAIETVTGYRHYKHGEAISVGMMAAATMAHRLGICSDDMVIRQARLLTRLGLPTRLPQLDQAEVMWVLASDKKVVGGNIHFVLPESIGSVRVQKVEEQAILAALKELGLN